MTYVICEPCVGVKGISGLHSMVRPPLTLNVWPVM